MKLLILSLLLALSLQRDFCDGWDDGYKAGYCYRVEGCVAPPTPVCPVPEWDEDTYKDGYKRGFLRGLSERE